MLGPSYAAPAPIIVTSPCKTSSTTPPRSFFAKSLSMELTEQPHQHSMTHTSGGSTTSGAGGGGFGTNSSVGSQGLGASRQEERPRGRCASEDSIPFRQAAPTTATIDSVTSKTSVESHRDHCATSESADSHDDKDDTRCVIQIFYWKCLFLNSLL